MSPWSTLLISRPAGRLNSNIRKSEKVEQSFSSSKPNGGDFRGSVSVSTRASAAALRNRMSQLTKALPESQSMMNQKAKVGMALSSAYASTSAALGTISFGVAASTGIVVGTASAGLLNLAALGTGFGLAVNDLKNQYQEISAKKSSLSGDSSKTEILNDKLKQCKRNVVQTGALFSGSIGGAINAINSIATVAASTLASPTVAGVAAATLLTGTAAAVIGFTGPAFVCLGGGMMSIRETFKYIQANKQIKQKEGSIATLKKDIQIKNNSELSKLKADNNELLKDNNSELSKLKADNNELLRDNNSELSKLKADKWKAGKKMVVGAGLFMAGSAAIGAVVATGGLALIPLAVGTVGVTIAAGGLSADKIFGNYSTPVEKQAEKFVSKNEGKKNTDSVKYALEKFNRSSKDEIAELILRNALKAAKKKPIQTTC